MARFVGVEIPNEKKVKISLTYLYGIGRVRAEEIASKANVDPEKPMGEISSDEESRLRSIIENYQVEGELRQENQRNIRRLQEIKCYRGVRHKLGLPVRGQRTRHNAHTRKGKSLPVGGLKRTLEKT